MRRGRPSSRNWANRTPGNDARIARKGDLRVMTFKRAPAALPAILASVMYKVVLSGAVHAVHADCRWQPAR
jgi:hypothetical protein